MTGGFAVRLVLPRLGLALVTLLGVSILIFWAVALLPGDVAREVLGREATPQAVAVLRDQLGLNRSPVARYGSWVQGLVTGDWGTSLAARRPVSDLVVPRLANTLTLAGIALAFYVPLAVGLGTLTALWRGRLVSICMSAVVLVLTAVPEFVLGILLQYGLAVWRPWFPPLATSTGQSGWGTLHALTLPALTLALAMTGYAVRMMYSSLVTVLDSDYVRLATLLGLPRWRVLVRHAIPNALGPVLRVTVLNVAWVIGGVVLVENIYNYPGIGQLLVQSIQVHDVPVVEAVALIMSCVYILANLAADLCAAVLNPKLRG